MSRAVILCGGTISNYNYIKSQIKPDDTIICADSGYNHTVKMQIGVDLLVGDLDSVGIIPDGVEIIKFPAKKDLTDSEIALSCARERGFNEFLLIGATGARLDHTLTNLFLLKTCLLNNENAQIIDDYNRMFLIDRECDLNEPKGTLVSLVPLADCTGVTATGLEYPLAAEDLPFGSGRGISNVMLGHTARVSIETGVLAVILARD